MNDIWKFSFWIFWLLLSTVCFSQATDYTGFESKPPETIELFDNKSLFLNETYCLEQITAKTVFDNFHGDHSRSSYGIKIMWKSETIMTSIKLESNSLNDSYCEAKNKHYYYRKPLNQSFHVFPDEIHVGVRFIPIKLHCKYIITPELDGMCQALRLRYTTPVCIDNSTCTCRHVNISAPALEAELNKDGIDVFWSFPDEFIANVSIIAISIYSEDGINIKKLVNRKIGIENLSMKNSVKYKQNFKLNNTADAIYRIQGFFENGISCRGNSTFLLLRHSETRRLNYDKIILYAMAFIFILLFFLMCLLYSWKKEVRKICVKLFPLRLCEPDDSSDDLTRKGLPTLKTSVYNPIYESSCRDSEPFNYRDLVVIKEIASGNFGVVSLAYSPVSLRGCNEFAIKQIKDKAGPEGETDFMEEIEMFKLVGDHPNVVKMFGYCLSPHPLTIIMEYVPFNLLTYLKNLRTEFERKKSEAKGFVKYAQVLHSRTSSISFSDDNYISPSEVECTPLNKTFQNQEPEYLLDNTELGKFGLQIAKGMAHLEFKNIVHRDLAARNVLMDYGKILKISDFGMSKFGIYVNKRSKKFPLRWMSPEALVNRVFSSKSDVWSFGVVLWEIGTLGAFPYSNLQNEEVISLLKKGEHLEKPENITAQFYSVMVDCWARSPDERPTFADLVNKIEGFCQKSNGYVDFENLESNYVFPPMEEEINQEVVK